MKNEPWIDQVFKSQLQAHEVPLDMNHWAQAETLIIAQEKEKNKRKIIIWLFLTGIGLMIAWISLKQDHPTNIPIQPSSPEHFPIQNPISNLPATAYIKEEACPEFTIADKKVAASKNHMLSINQSPSPFVTVIQKTSVPTASEGQLKENTRQIGFQKSPDSHKLSPGLHDLSGVENNTLYDNQNSVDQSKMPRDLHILTLEHTINYLPVVARELSGQRDESDKAPISVHAIGWSERGIRMTLAQATGLQLANPAIAHAGIEYYHQKSMGPNLFYGYSLGYKSNFNHSQYAQVISAIQFNGFGSNVQNFGIKPIWMNALFVQGIAGVSVKKNRLFVALKPEYIVGVKGNVDQLLFKETTTGIKDIAQAQVSSINKGWLQSDALNRLVWTMSLGYEFRIMQRVGVGFQFDHNFRSPFRTLDAQIRQAAASSWNTGFRISYLIN